MPAEVAAAIGGPMPAVPSGQRFWRAGDWGIQPHHIRAAISHGLTLAQACRVWGRARCHTLRIVHRYGMVWPNMDRMRSGRWAWYRGQWLQLGTIARLNGSCAQTLHKDYHRGIHGAALVERRERRVLPDVYETGHSHSDWRHILEHAEEKGAQVTSKLFDVPIGAIRCAQRGEWERLG